jgi:signal transduction histidine kinase/ActR/RegA family two-component response regulator
MSSETLPQHYLQAVADALTILLEPGRSFASATTRFLGRLGSAVGVDRAYYFENDPGSAPVTASQRCEWVREGVPRELHNPLLQNMCYETSLPGALSVLSSGTTFSLFTGDSEPPLREILEAQEIRSLALMPVHSHGEFLGFIGFDDCGTERAWKDEELESLRAAAAGLGSAIMRHRMEESMSARADELTKSRRVALSLMEDARKAVASSQQANEAKSAFLAMISHEIRAPLNGVIGFTDLLLAENLPGHQAEIVSTIRSCGKSLLDLMSDILDLSKIESGRMDLELVQCSLRECLGEVLASLEPSLKSKKLSLSTHVGDSVPAELVTDPKRLRQIFSNLIGNAIKFTAEGGVSVRVEAGPRPGGRLQLDCEVSDTGIGIPEEEQRRIFEMFGQATPSVARRFGGSGLGLAICRKLVEAMGGEISVKSAPGKGASFRFTIPAYRAQGIRRFEAAEDSPLADMEGLRILAVDDVSTNTRLMSGLLKKLGCVTATAADGQQAVQLAEETGFDIIFMDVLMPVCDGLEATEMIRKLEEETPGRKPAYIVALTADAFAENKARCLEAGMDEFLTKPLRMDLIRSAIQRGIKKANLAAQPPPPVGT